MNYQDKTLQCRDCGIEFQFTVGEQAHFASKGFVNDPTRCRGCRAIARARQAMLGGAPPPPVREMHAIVCAQCGSPAQVPFLPRLDKPVYCSSCFDQVRATQVTAES